MPPTNDFLTIANDPSANVQTQVNYAADPDRVDFFADGGIPDANQHGKMFRQLSAIIRAVAQAVCDITGLDMLDDGNSATQLAHLKSLLQQAAGAPNFAVSTGAGDAYVVALSPAVTIAAPGFRFSFKANFSNVAVPTIDFGIGAKTVNMPPVTDAPIAGFIAATRYYDCLYDGTLVQISQVNTMVASGDYPIVTTVVPNDGNPHTIMQPFQGAGGGEVIVGADDSAGNAWLDIVPCYGFTNGSPSSVPSNTAGAPGTRTYITPTGGTSRLTLTRQNGVGPANITVTARYKARE